MLKYVYGAETGIRHRRRGECGADSALALKEGDTLFFALSDGAGSSALSHRISQTVVYEAIRLMQGGVSPADLLTLLAATIREVFSGVDTGDLYATFVGGMYSERGTLVYTSIGDSVALFRRGGVWHSSPIVKGEFANETVFLLSQGWQDFAVYGEEEDVDALVVSSDGLGGIYFFYKMREDASWYVEVSQGYLDKLTDAVCRGSLTYENIGDLLGNEKIMEINDDDKSVVIACHDL